MIRQSMLMVVILLGLSQLACAPGVDHVDHDADFDVKALATKSWAVGGVVANSDFEWDGVMEVELEAAGSHPVALAEAYSHHLFGAMLETNPDLQLAPFGAFQAEMPEARLNSLLEAVAAGDDAVAARMAGLEDFISGVEYLVFARLDESRIKSQTGRGLDLSVNAAERSRNPQSSFNENAGTIERTLEVTMTVFQLPSGRSVWSGSVERSVKELFKPDPEKRPAQWETPQADGEKSSPVLDGITGSPLQAPGFEKPLKAACRALAEELFGSE